MKLTIKDFSLKEQRFLAFISYQRRLLVRKGLIDISIATR